jgi:ketosteroid isomerase-like protein
MRKITLTSVLYLAAAVVPAMAATPTETVTAFHTALANGKTDQALTLLSPNVRIFESGFVERSRSEYASHHLGDDAAFAKSTSDTVHNQQELLKGDLAVVTRETETSGKFKGATVHTFGTETAVLEKQGDNWFITHIHWSSRKAK